MANDNENIPEEVGNFRIIKKLSSGAFGAVYLGEHKVLSGYMTAIKLLHSQLLSEQSERERFLQEAQTLARLKQNPHPHVLPLLDFGCLSNGSLYLITEYASNGSLAERIKRCEQKPLPFEDALSILIQVGKGLESIHQQDIIHRDLKPANILFNAQSQALIADFGIALAIDNGRTQAVDQIGTPYYMAPEQFRDTASKKSDQYALGVIAYELFAGRRPFVAETPLALGFMHITYPPPSPSQFNADIPVHIEQAILKALAKSRDERFKDVQTFVAALTNAPVAIRPQWTKTKEQWLREAIAFHQAKEYEKALAAYQEVVLLDSTSPLPWQKIAEILVALKRYTEALVVLERALHLDPDHAEASLWQGRAFFSLARFHEALISYDHVLSVKSNLAPAWQEKAEALAQLGRPEEALGAYEHLLTLAPSNVRALRRKGDLLVVLKRYEEALAAYRAAQQEAPNDVELSTVQGYILLRLKHYKDALSIFDQAVCIDPKRCSAYVGQGHAFTALKFPEEALQAYQTALQLDPDSVDAYIGKGQALHHLLQYQAALASYNQAIERASESTQAWHGKGNVLESLHCNQEALQVYEHAIKLEPSEATFYLSKSILLKKLKRYEEALTACQQALQRRPDFVVAQTHLNDLLKHLRRRRKPE